MTLLVLFFILSCIVGGIRLRACKSNKNAAVAYFSITTLGAVLWGSILLHHPFDLNEAIGRMLSQLYEVFS
ncbi:hypothetical protein DVH26_31435 [Paenibacillus sp. H1-7]|uniref:hypothetical protein n=1 Tax=Paenibacillus sp. H1-7 TaxID=2282849 RepID=UPI001EF80D58|nr:hypothetical protein [Paenibacillus sp. H1-7]ULL18589.1 hypothetical protein DVH26_31435 [Paenibacillus sp. H1-7]